MSFKGVKKEPAKIRLRYERKPQNRKLRAKPIKAKTNTGSPNLVTGRPKDFEGVETKRITITFIEETHRELWRALPDSGHKTQNQFINEAILRYVKEIRRKKERKNPGR